MFGLFAHIRPRPARIDVATLGAASIALALPAGAAVPQPATGVVFDGAGRIRRVGAGARLVLTEGEAALCFHAGPYRIDLTPFAAAPEIGLSLSFAVDCPDPRVAQQRFDLYLVAEAADGITLATLAARLEHAVQHELAQGNLELPPCTTLDEWHAFRSGLDRLLYTRFGITVDDCLPVDLGERVDYAALLRSRAAAGAGGVSCAPGPDIAATPPPIKAGAIDREALRRLYLELPGVMGALRLVSPAAGAFSGQRELLQRLDLANVQVATMAALELAAPGRLLPEPEQQRRARACLRAAATLDEAWAWLARAPADCGAASLDELDRIVTNLELALGQRRAVQESVP